jgi:signal transduction histidine kinase
MGATAVVVGDASFSDTSIPTELTSSVTWSRTAVIAGMLGLLIAGRALAHLPIPLLPLIAIALLASLYNGILALLAWRTTRQAPPAGDRSRARILYAGGVLDTIALALVVLFTGGLLSPWLYFFLATSITASAMLPPTPGRVLTTVNGLVALLVVALPLFKLVPVPVFVLPPGLRSQPAYAAIVGMSLVGLMVVTARAVRVPVERARAAAHFQEGLAQIAATLQRAEAGVEHVLSSVCLHAHHWFNVDRTLLTLLQGEELIVKAGEGADAAQWLNRRTPVSDAQSLEVEVLRRRRGFYVNSLQRSPYAAWPSVAGSGDQAVLLVPLTGSLGVLGVLRLSDRRRPAPFSPTTLQRARILAAHAGAAVENARLLERVREEAESVTALLRASEGLTRSDDLSTLLAHLNRIAAEMAGCDRSTTFLWDTRHDVFCFGSTFGTPPALAARMRDVEFGRGTIPIIETALKSEALVASAGQAAQLPAALQPAFQAGTSVFVPLKTDDHLQGIMTVSHLDPSRDFSAEQLWMLRGIARHAALAIERARLMAQERAAALENARLLDEVREANRVKSDFLSAVSHELRTPLNAIIGYTDLLRERALGPLLPEQLEATDIVAKKGQQLLELINTTLDLTQLEGGRVHIQPSVFPLDDLLAEIHDELADEAAPEVAFTWTAAPALPPLTTDRAKLKTIIKNLVHNALKFTSSGSVEIQADLASIADHVQITVRDTGVGIAAEHVKVIFEMFRQLEPALTRHFGGVGLGLYIVQRLLQLIHGEVRVHSEPQRGSTFTVTVPVQLADSA